MEYLPGGIQLDIAPGCFPLTTDSMALAHFSHITGAKSVLDLGSGCGTLGLLLCSQNPRLHVTGMELDPKAHAAAQENIRRNGLDARMESICADMRCLPPTLPAGQFDCCISNPPYFPGGPAARLTAARREDTCTLSQLMDTGAKALKYGGDLFLVHRPERLAEIIALGAPHRLEAKRLCLVRHQEGGSISLALLALRKGGKPGLSIEEWTLYHRDGHKTPICREIYHITEE